MPRASIGTMLAPAAALFAASGAATPSIAPFPNSLGFLASRFSTPYARNVASAAPDPGSTPDVKPTMVPRIQGPSSAATPAAVSQSRLVGSRSAAPDGGAAISQSASPTANSPTAPSATSMPPYSSGRPKVKRASPVWRSMPMVDRPSPRHRATIVRGTDLPPTAVTSVSASSISATYSGGPNSRLIVPRLVAVSISMNVAKVPPMNEPIAAVARATPPWPSFRHRVAVDRRDRRGRIARRVDQDRRRRAAVHGAVVDAAEENERRRRIQTERQRQQDRDRDRGAQARQHADGGAEHDADRAEHQVVRPEAQPRNP